MVHLPLKLLDKSHLQVFIPSIIALKIKDFLDSMTISFTGGRVGDAVGLGLEVVGSILATPKLFSREPDVPKFVLYQFTQKKNAKG